MTQERRATSIAADELRIELGGRVVLDDVTLAIGAREFVAVLGPNGAGKTSLFRAILGLLTPARGRISVLGAAPRRGNPEVGYMPQTRGVASQHRLAAREFIATVADGHRLGVPLPTRAARAEVDRALDIVGARSLATRPLHELSGGERQRVLLAQALIGRPRLLLLDEPLASLDPAQAGAAVALARSVQAELGIAVLFSAHDINPLLPAVDRVLYLSGGRAALGTVDEVIAGPVLSRLYGTPIDVVRAGGRIFVMSGPHDLGHTDHA
ncbi:MAG: ATP-binding cassette domain-containing protein [Acidisphaera sp.]|nr:ATP-binding cassette domain-containing protein [Acidisphaera sp.]MBV9811306.1 ATP-binding cassette domain-containing protein [Acetobacteraceae bacterium]